MCGRARTKPLQELAGRKTPVSMSANLARPCYIKAMHRRRRRCASRVRFPGQYFDAETGLNYNLNREYESGTGRYIESDPIGLYGAISTYSYAGSSPLNLVDANGLEAKSAQPVITCGLWEWLFKNGAGTAGGAAAGQLLCPDGKEDCEGRCNCKYKIRNAKCLANPACLQRSYGVLVDCLFDCAGGDYKPNPNDEGASTNG
mgnify:CR=1 FL=1